jgi:hypothetical protein
MPTEKPGPAVNDAVRADHTDADRERYEPPHLTDLGEVAGDTNATGG